MPFIAFFPSSTGATYVSLASLDVEHFHRLSLYFIPLTFWKIFSPSFLETLKEKKIIMFLVLTLSGYYL